MGTTIAQVRAPGAGAPQQGDEGGEASSTWQYDATALPTELEQRILAAACRLVARWGVAKTTIADIAREAGCSRATVYRAFPGGKQQLFTGLGYQELDCFFNALIGPVDRASTLGDALVTVLVVASRGLAGHDALQFVLAHEPGLVLPFLGFNQIDRLYAAIRDRLGPHLRRFVASDADAAWAAEWTARVVLSFQFDADTDTDPGRQATAAQLVERFLLPALSPIPAPTA